MQNIKKKLNTNEIQEKLILGITKFLNKNDPSLLTNFFGDNFLKKIDQHLLERVNLHHLILTNHKKIYRQKKTAEIRDSLDNINISQLKAKAKNLEIDVDHIIKTVYFNYYVDSVLLIKGSRRHEYIKYLQDNCPINFLLFQLGENNQDLTDKIKEKLKDQIIAVTLQQYFLQYENGLRGKTLIQLRNMANSLKAKDDILTLEHQATLLFYCLDKYDKQQIQRYNELFKNKGIGLSNVATAVKMQHQLNLMSQQQGNNCSSLVEQKTDIQWSSDDPSLTFFEIKGYDLRKDNDRLVLLSIHSKLTQYQGSNDISSQLLNQFNSCCDEIEANQTISDIQKDANIAILYKNCIDEIIKLEEQQNKISIEKAIRVMMTVEQCLQNELSVIIQDNVNEYLDKQLKQLKQLKQFKIIKRIKKYQRYCGGRGRTKARHFSYSIIYYNICNFFNRNKIMSYTKIQSKLLSILSLILRHKEIKRSDYEDLLNLKITCPIKYSKQKLTLNENSSVAAENLKNNLAKLAEAGYDQKEAVQTFDDLVSVIICAMGFATSRFSFQCNQLQDMISKSKEILGCTQGQSNYIVKIYGSKEFKIENYREDYNNDQTHEYTPVVGP